MSTPPLSVPLRFTAREALCRRGEPVTVGLPWPRGVLSDDRLFRLVGPDGTPQTVQTRVLDRWPDGSIRWCLFDFFATLDGRTEGYRVEVHDTPRTPPPGVRADRIGGVQRIDTGPVSILLGQPHDHFLKAEVRAGGTVHTLGGYLFHPIHGIDRQEVRDLDVEVDEDGPVRTRVGFRWGLWGEGPAAPGGSGKLLDVFGHLDAFTGSPVVRVQLTVRNPHPADHPGGNWDLGNGGSLYLRSLGFVAATSHAGPTTARLTTERGQPFRELAVPVRLHQESSGGENWASRNHLTRKREVPFRYRGYKLTHPGGEVAGLRATPVVTREQENRFLGLAVPDFWENFPKAVAVDGGSITLELFPEEPGGETELQGGEQKTHVFYLALGRDGVTAEPLAWCRSPLVCHADPEWYAATGAVPYLTPKAADPNSAYLALVDQALDGPDTFAHKREKIDEYGWRNYGDVYGDHEAVFHPGPAPLVSHYNNQYDCVAGFLWQFLRSADVRWLTEGLACADHTCDVDVYHTDADKPAYNGGLFWHTYHYADADTGTHRSYPRSVRSGGHATTTGTLGGLGATGRTLRQTYAVGGGPSASNNYNLGLLLAYFLTGNPIYRETAVGLARYVLAIDDPSRSVFRWLSRQPTGLATESGAGYHGPGRGSGNSIVACLVGHQLTGERAFLDKAEEVIRRASHPRQDLDSLDLLNAELRWYYTMHLVGIGRYLDYKAELGELDRMYAYARLTLLHYAQWMAANERPTLAHPEKLHYPTETWAAQDMRKVEVLQYAARHATGEERARFLERAEWFFRYVERTLTGFETKSLCRPVILLMTNGWSRAWWQRHPNASAPEPAVAVTPEEFGEWRMFVPQKAIALKRAKRLAAAGAAGFALAAAAGVAWLAS